MVDSGHERTDASASPLVQFFTDMAAGKVSTKSKAHQRRDAIQAELNASGYSEWSEVLANANLLRTLAASELKRGNGSKSESQARLYFAKKNRGIDPIELYAESLRIEREAGHARNGDKARQMAIVTFLPDIGDAKLGTHDADKGRATLELISKRLKNLIARPGALAPIMRYLAERA